MKYLAFLALLFFNRFGFSQNDKISYKFGKVSIDELKLDSCDFYKDADAMVFFNIGDLTITNDNVKGIVYSLKVHKRMKIFSKKGKELASDKIRYYKAKAKRHTDEIRSFKAYTFNLENGEIVKTKLRKQDKFKNTIDKYNEELSYTMPNVNIGSVIDIKYEIVSMNLGSLRTWYFQDIIPVKYNKLSYTMPEIFQYNVNTLGNFKPSKVEKKYDNISIGYLDVYAETKIFVQENILPFEIEPYMSNIKSVLARIEFNLVSINPKYSPSHDYGSTYEKMNEKLFKDYDFGKRLSKGSFSKSWNVEKYGKSKLDKAKFILEKFQKEIAFNKIYSIYTDYSGKKLFKKKVGDIGDINLNLIAALRYHDIEAYPVVLRTRDRGIPHPTYPKIWAFNYVVVLVKIDDKEYLCDGTLNVPFGLIRQSAVNYEGWLVDAKGRWIDLTKDALYKESIMSTIDIKNDSIFNKISFKLKDYAAVEAFNKFQNGKFKDELNQSLSEWEIINLDFSDNNNFSNFSYSVNLKKEIEDDEMILINPFTINGLKDNPFKKDKRMSNVDFKNKKIKNFYTVINIPSNYSIESPKGLKISTEDKKLKYLYYITKDDKKITALNKLTFYKSVFTPSEYAGLKNFYEKIVASNKQVIILKKIK